MVASKTQHCILCIDKENMCKLEMEQKLQFKKQNTNLSSGTYSTPVCSDSVKIPRNRPVTQVIFKLSVIFVDQTNNQYYWPAN